MTAADAVRDLSADDVRQRLELLSALGLGFLESGQSGGQTSRVLTSCASLLGLAQASVTVFGRVVLTQAHAPDGGSVSVSGAARTLDVIDCSRLRGLADVAARIGESARVDVLRDDVSRVRDRATNGAVTTAGLTMLAVFITMQVGVLWQAWVTAAVLQLISSFVGLGASRVLMPRLFAAAVQSAAGGAVATALVLAGFVDPVGAAAAIAVTWLLILPLPQLISAVTDAIDADYLSAMSRAGSLAVTAVGIALGGVVTFALGELFHMEHPRIDDLPSMPWYLVLVFSGLGALSNALANGGRRSLILPALVLGVVTGATNQLLLRVVGLDALWASSLSGVVLGVVTVVFAARTGYPQQVLALMGITGALLPGLQVFLGILQQMSGGSGLAHFGTAAAICLSVGVGVALGAYLASLFDPSRFSVREQLRGQG
ncbi:threonine/serine exporter family protein [Microbacterium sp. No. 7]|uniref:threonine/serine exporter family protein n=1 Tax=Microbacterium sp. No. 7 TaxID=1714373 RepID=UPI0006D0BA78|nr:threonine/serine exporter family protein [Microbacterium sp. No. 7]ALJ20059.1 hypothetical protein AOA12_09110 [Microbacterium sp. No. 7]